MFYYQNMLKFLRFAALMCQSVKRLNLFKRVEKFWRQNIYLSPFTPNTVSLPVSEEKPNNNSVCNNANNAAVLQCEHKASWEMAPLPKHVKAAGVRADISLL